MSHAAGEAAPPTFTDFMAWPRAAIRPLAPATLILGAGGTRRRATLAGFSPNSQAYAAWTRQQMIACHARLFDHGVQHLLSIMMVSSHAAETTPGYHEKILGWMRWAAIGPEALDDYARHGWRVRLLGVESWPELAEVDAELRAQTDQHPGPTLWYTVASRPERTWARLLQVAAEQQITDRAALVRALYGEDIPPATLYLGSGKPQVEGSQLPYLLLGKVECYWRQHLGYDLDEATLRRVLYDYAYLRPTWRADKTGRAEAVMRYAHAWEQPPVIGLGTRMGPFWYPDAIAAVPAPAAPAQEPHTP